MPGSDYILGGPVFWVMTGLLFLAGMLAAFVALDATRRYTKPAADGTRSGRLLVYIIPQAMYVVLLLLGQVRAMPIIVTGLVVIGSPLVLVQGIAYLLRVVFPKPDAVVMALDAEGFELLADGGDTIEPESSPAPDTAAAAGADDESPVSPAS